jgi:hypothetical protein
MGGAITSQDVLAGPPDTHHMTSKKFITTHRGELTNRPDMDNLDAGTPLRLTGLPRFISWYVPPEVPDLLGAMESFV